MKDHMYVICDWWPCSQDQSRNSCWFAGGSLVSVDHRSTRMMFSMKLPRQDGMRNQSHVPLSPTITTSGQNAGLILSKDGIWTKTLQHPRRACLPPYTSALLSNTPAYWLRYAPSPPTWAGSPSVYINKRKKLPTYMSKLGTNKANTPF